MSLLTLSRMQTKALHVTLLLSVAPAALGAILALNKMLHFPVDETCLCPYIGFMSLPETGRLL